MTMIYPDLEYILSMVNRYCINPNFIYVVVVLQILKYVCGMLYYSLTYIKDQLGFVGYTDIN